jgi:hypothetical protein
MKMSPAMKRALARAANRERGNICPIRGVWANAETMLIDAMDRRGFVAWDYPDKINEHGVQLLHRGCPRISQLGRWALEENQ